MSSTAQQFNQSTIFPSMATKYPSYSDAPDAVPIPMQIIIGILLFTIMIPLGIVGNILVLLAVILDKTLRQHDGNLMILNLAVTDLLIACCSMPVLGFQYYFSWPSWTFEEGLCKTTMYITFVTVNVSVGTILFISLDRYFAIVRNKKMLKRRNVKILLCLL